MWDLPGPELMSPALAGGFLTTGPLGKSRGSFLRRTLFVKTFKIPGGCEHGKG